MGVRFFCDGCGHEMAEERPRLNVHESAPNDGFEAYTPEFFHGHACLIAWCEREIREGRQIGPSVVMPQVPDAFRDVNLG
jgi:hypothetical protein